jgi:hypothetical protein
MLEYFRAARSLYVEIWLWSGIALLVVVILNGRKESEAVENEKGKTTGFARGYWILRRMVVGVVEIGRFLGGYRDPRPPGEMKASPSPEPEFGQREEIAQSEEVIVPSVVHVLPSPEPVVWQPTPVEKTLFVSFEPTVVESTAFASVPSATVTESPSPTIEPTFVKTESPRTPLPTVTPTPFVVETTRIVVTPSPTRSVPDVPKTPEPSPSIDPERITWSEASHRLWSVHDQLWQHVDETKKLVSALNSDFEDMIEVFESEVEIYCTGGPDNPSKGFGFLKFQDYLNEISLPKGPFGLWEATWDGRQPKAFVFRTIRSKVQIAEKLTFGSVAKTNCLTKDFFIVLRARSGPEIATRVYTMESWRNVTLPFPTKFDTLSIIALSNHGNTTTVCLPDFRVYQRLGFVSGESTT